MSAAPRGGEGAMMRTGRVGQSAAGASTGWMQMTPTTSATARRFIWSLDSVLCSGDRHAEDASFAEPSQAPTMSHGHSFCLSDVIWNRQTGQSKFQGRENNHDNRACSIRV